MKLPYSAADIKKTDIKNNTEFIKNPYFNKKFLTKVEALDAANMLIGMVLLDERVR